MQSTTFLGKLAHRIFNFAERNAEKSPDLTIRGEAGTSIFSGYISEDFNADWQSPKSIDKVTQMRLTSGLIRGLLQAIFLPIMRADYRVEFEDDEEMVEFVEKQLFETLERPFGEWLREALNYLPYGFYYFEKIWIKDETGNIILKDLAPRLPSAHGKWEMSNGEKGITQQLPTAIGGKTQPEIPMDKLVLFTFQKEGDNYEGISILRSAWSHFWYIDNLFRIQAIAAERYGVGLPIIKLPKNYSSEDKALAEQLGRNLRSNEEAYAVLPDGWDIEIKTPTGSPEGSNINEAIDKHSKLMAVSMLAQMVLLGMDNQGSYALSRDQSSFFLLGLQSIADQIADIIDSQIIKDIVDFNYGVQEKYPKFKFSNIDRIDYGEYSKMLADLINSGLLSPDNTLEEFIREQLKLPQAETMEQKMKQRIEDEKVKEKMIPKEQPEKPEEKEIPEIPEKQPEEEITEEEMSQKKNIMFAEFKPWRELTLAEKRVNFSQISNVMDTLGQTLREKLDEITKKQKEIFFARIEAALRGENITALKNAALNLAPATKQIVKEYAQEALDFGKKQAAKEIKTTVPTTPKWDNQILDQEIDEALEERMLNLNKTVKTTARNSLKKGIGVAAALFAASQAFDDEADLANQSIAGKFIINPINVGRSLVFDENKEEIYALQRSEILDERTCNVCLSLDGRVLHPDDPFTKLDQVHTNCRGIWVAALKKDEYLPEIKSLPKSILGKFETKEGIPAVNQVQPMAAPKVTKDSRAFERQNLLPQFE